MLLVGKCTKKVDIKIFRFGYENNNSFTKFLQSPLRDTSLEAAQRSKSASVKRVSTGIEKKIKQLESFKQRLSFEKKEFEKFEKYKNFFEKVNFIVQKRWKVEEKSAVLIQSAFRGYFCRKVYLQVGFT
jgi:IQ calmodulin-binding motif.